VTASTLSRDHLLLSLFEIYPKEADPMLKLVLLTSVAWSLVS